MQNPSAFGIALMGVLLEHQWPEDTCKVITQVRDALVSGDAKKLRAAANAAANAATNATNAAYYAAYSAANAAYAAANAAYAAYSATAYYAAYYAAHHAKRAVPSESERIDALHTLFK